MASRWRIPSISVDLVALYLMLLMSLYSLLSAGRGGEGKLGSSFNSSGVRRWRWEAEAQEDLGASEAGSCGGAHQQRPSFADAIHGIGRPSAPGYQCCLGSFFLNWKIFDLGVGIITAITPSGFVPGGDGGARAWRSSALCGEDEGPDCFFDESLKALFAKFEDQFVISFLCRVPLVSVTSPLKE
jgi:hypothetical protein